LNRAQLLLTAVDKVNGYCRPRVQIGASDGQRNSSSSDANNFFQFLDAPPPAYLDVGDTDEMAGLLTYANDAPLMVPNWL